MSIKFKKLIFYDKKFIILLKNTEKYNKRICNNYVFDNIQLFWKDGTILIFVTNVTNFQMAIFIFILW